MNRAMGNAISLPELKIINVDELWFQRNGAIRQTANKTINLLKKTISERIISRRGPVA